MSSAFLILDQAWDELANRLWNLQLDDQHGLVPNDGWLPSPEKVNDDPRPRTEEALWSRLTDLASLLNYKTLRDDRAYTDNMWACIADVSRDLPILRVLFGLRRRPSRTEDEEQLGEAVEPDCVLEAARRLLDPAKTNLTPRLRKQALRIVANCCADNDVNRALIIGRDGIEYLKILASTKQELDILLPTMYNICVDYDVMAMGSDGTQVSMDGKMVEPGMTGDGMMLTVAEQVLGKFNDKLQKTSIEVFLSLWQDIEPEQHSVLADIMELASRPAIFDVEYVFGTNDPSLMQSRLRNLFDALSLEAQNFQDDARESVLQTYFNLLTQPIAQEHMARSTDDLESFVVLLYGDQEKFIHNDTFPSAFLKLSYAISSLSAYAEAIPLDFDSDFILHLVHIANVGWQPVAPILVLLSNSLTSIDRISRFQKSEFYVEQNIVPSIGSATDSDTLIPALSLCTRLAFTPEGQTELYSVNIYSALTRLLARQAPPGYSLQAEREAIILARLVVKSQLKHAEALLTKDFALFTAILSLASTTIDATSKLEAGRFVVEVLRTLFARSTADNAGTTSDTTAANDPLTKATLPERVVSESHPPDLADIASLFRPEHFSPKTSGSAITAILFLIIDAPSSAIRAEGLFSLALLSTLHARNINYSIITCLREQKEKVWPVLEDIVTAAEQPARKAEVENLKYLLSHLLKAQPAQQTPTSLEASNEQSDYDIEEQEGFEQELHDLATRLGLSLTAC